MRSNWSVRPSDSWSRPAISRRQTSFVKMPSAGGPLPGQILPPASASALAIAKPNPPSSDTPATKARLPFRSIASMDPLPADGRAGPGEPGAECGEDEEIAAAEPPGGERLVERDGNRGGGRVAVPVDVGVYLVGPQPGQFLDHLDDAEIRMVRHEEGHVARREPVGLQREVHGLRHEHRGELEHLAPVHHRPVLALLQHLLAHVGVVRQAGAVDPQFFRMTAVGEEMHREHAASWVIGGAEHHRARAVAEQDGRVPAAGRLVEPARVHLGADQEDAAVGAGADPGVGHGETVQEAAALVPHVDRGDVADAQLALQEYAVAGLEMVGGAGAVDDAVEIAGLEASLGQGLAGGLARQRDAGLAVRHPVARLDAAALRDPLIRRVHEPGQVVIGDEPGRDVKAGGDELGARHQISHGTCCGRRAKGEDFAPESPRQGTRMDLTVTRPQYDAVRGAKHLPDVLRQALDRAKPSGQAYVLRLTYEEATALNELCAWNVHTDGAGNVTPESRVFDDLVKAIITHPDY